MPERNQASAPKGIQSPQSEYAKRLNKMARTDCISHGMQQRYAEMLAEKSDALLQLPPMQLVDEMNGVEIHEGVCPIEGTLVVKGTTMIDGFLYDIITNLEKRCESSLEFKKFMYALFGTYFCHGININLVETPSSAGNMADTPSTRVRVHWLSLFEDPSLTKNQPYDMVFASKAFMYKQVNNTGKYEHVQGPMLPDIVTLAWDSFPNLTSFREVDTGCRRLHLYKSGFLVQRTSNGATCRLSLVLAFREPYVAEWAKELVLNLHAFARPPFNIALVPPSLWSYNEYCYVCFKSFRFFRRRHHCRLCGNAVCSKCSFTTPMAVPKDTHRYPPSSSIEKKIVLVCVKCGQKPSNGSTEARLTTSASALRLMHRSASTNRIINHRSFMSDASFLSQPRSSAPPRAPRISESIRSYSTASIDMDGMDISAIGEDVRVRTSHRNSDPSLLLPQPLRMRAHPAFMGQDLIQVERQVRGSRRSDAPLSGKTEDFAYNQGFTARSIDPRASRRRTSSKSVERASESRHRKSPAASVP
ncbi:hypothetical protein THRCLA_02382 [Thraustotheca clavata]|uniref:FYVE-type domain-containing protein n=1 Tax=Thraustotheca clavata TaxID=74557 RepID=A0A1W0A5D9_9STRA|nr:hypothetical protein THRCLA_02382 [Thraustotheca clavata]